MKKCSICKNTYELSKFSIRNDKEQFDIDHPSRYRSACMSCVSFKSKLKYYKISKETYLELLKDCNNSCSICGIPEEEARLLNSRCKHLGLYIDHCHSTGKVRGFLCHNCNLIIGHAKDDIKILLKAIEYLSRDEMV